MPYTIEQIKQKTAPIFKSYGVKKAYIFGSYAKGEQTDESDLDIFTDSNGQLKGLDFVGLLESLVMVFDVDIDLFDSSHIDKKSELYNQVLNSRVKIYEKQKNN